MPTYTAKPGLYVSDGGLETSYEWQRDGVAISGETGLSYTTVSPDDDFSEVAFAETAVDTNGSVTNRVVAQPLPFPVYLRFAANSRVEATYDNANFPIRNFTYALRIRVNSIPASNISFVSASSGPDIRLQSDGQLRVVAPTANPSSFDLQGQVLSSANPGDLYSIIVSASLDGNLPGGKYLQAWVNGSLAHEETDPPTGLTSETYFQGRRWNIEPSASVDIVQWFWFDPTANDPLALAPLIFDAANNYEVRDIGPGGVVNGVSPGVFFNGPPSVWNVPTNSGTGVDVISYSKAGDPITGLLT